MEGREGKREGKRTTTTTVKHDGHAIWNLQMREVGCQKDAGGRKRDARKEEILLYL